MKITALLVFRVWPDGSKKPLILSKAYDFSQFSFLVRNFSSGEIEELITFFGQTFAGRTPPGQRQSVQHEEDMVHSHNRNGLCALAFTDTHYPVRSAFSILNKVLDEYEKAFGDSCKRAEANCSETWPYLDEAISRFQDPAEADKLFKIQRDLDETKYILHKTIESVLERGEKLDDLMSKSSDLTETSLGFHKDAKNQNQCCVIM